MRKREEIWGDRNYKGQADESLLLEILLDIRDLLSAKSKSRRVLVEEVPLNEREQELLNNLQDN